MRTRTFRNVDDPKWLLFVNCSSVCADARRKRDKTMCWSNARATRVALWGMLVITVRNCVSVHAAHKHMAVISYKLVDAGYVDRFASVTRRRLHVSIFPFQLVWTITLEFQTFLTDSVEWLIQLNFIQSSNLNLISLERQFEWFEFITIWAHCARHNYQIPSNQNSFEMNHF